MNFHYLTDYRTFLRTQIVAVEGPGPEPYLDFEPGGDATIGYGTNIEGVKDYLLLVLNEIGVLATADFLESVRRTEGSLPPETTAERNARVQAMLNEFWNDAKTANTTVALQLALNTRAQSYGTSSFSITTQQALNVYNATLDGAVVAGVTIAGKESLLDARIGNSVAHNTQEYVALMSMFYNGEATIPPNSALVQALTDASRSDADRRAQAWFEIRYNTNPVGSPVRQGIANRRYGESDLFGLYENHPLDEGDAKAVMRMYTRYQGHILIYEAEFPPSSGFIDTELLPARSNLIATYGNGGGWTIDGEVYVGDNSANTPFVTSAHRLLGSTASDLIFGEAGNDVIQGGAGGDVVYGGLDNDFIQGELGSDFLAGGTGHDVYRGGGDNDELVDIAGFDYYLYYEGDGTDTIWDGDGLGAVFYDNTQMRGGKRDLNNPGWWFNEQNGSWYTLTDGYLVVNDSIWIGDFVNGKLGIVLLDENGNVEPAVPLDLGEGWDPGGPGGGVHKPRPTSPDQPGNSPAGPLGSGFKDPLNGPSDGPMGALGGLMEGFFEHFKSAETTPFSMSPLVLDLDGDGTESISVARGAYFDHNADGFAEATGWVGTDDALLVWDRDADGRIESGRELFGTETVLANGQKASNGFAALAELDLNADGAIDALDAIWVDLKLWRDTDGDGYSNTEELISVSAAGIQSISLSFTSGPGLDSEGNNRLLVGSYTSTDGSTRAITDYFFAVDGQTLAENWVNVTGDVAVLPNAQGFGTAGDLHQAIMSDLGGELQSLVEGFQAGSQTQRNALLDQIVMKWGRSEDVDPGSRGLAIDARKLVALETFTGRGYIGSHGPNPHGDAAPELELAYQQLREMIYAQLIAQTVVRTQFEAITYSWDSETQTLTGDLTPARTQLEAMMASDFQAGVVQANEFIRALKVYAGEDEIVDIDSLRINSNLAALIDGGMAFEGTANNDSINGTNFDDFIFGNAGNDGLAGRDGKDFIEGLDGADFLYGDGGNDVLKGGQGSDRLYGGAGDDTLNGGADLDILYGEGGEDVLTGDGDWLYGGDGADVLNVEGAASALAGEAGDDTLNGGAGDDILHGGAGNDILDGGAGNDVLNGGEYDPYYGIGYVLNGSSAGNDTYLFGRGSGQDSLFDSDSTAGNVDTIRLAADVLPEDVTLRLAAGLILSINGTTDTLTVTSWNSGASGQIERIEFANGTVWDHAYLSSLPYTGTEAADNFSAAQSHDTIYGLGGNDVLQGLGGNDVIDGGSGADTLYGQDGDDTLHGVAGTDTVYGGNGNDTLNAGDDADVLYGEAGNDFLNGGTDADALLGGADNDTLNGGDGDDFVHAGAGDDLIDGGAGNDFLNGGDHNPSYGVWGFSASMNESGNDTYLFGRGSGQDAILEIGNTVGNVDIVRLAADVLPEDVSIGLSNAGLVLRIIGTTDTLTVATWNNGTSGWVERIEFANGTVYDAAYLASLPYLGTEGNDSISASADANAIYGFGGNDSLQGLGGNDMIDGGLGDDYLYGQDADDSLFGQAGADRLYGGNGNDTLNGGSEVDILYGEGGNDVLNGDGALDVLYGQDGNDILNGGAGGDYLGGEAGNDTLNGGDGDDLLHAGAGDDVLDGGAGNDFLNGGDYSPYYGVGSASPANGLGNDTYLFGRGSGEDHLREYDNTAGNLDTVEFKAGIGLGDVQLSQAPNSLLVTVLDAGSATSDTLFIDHVYTPEGRVEQFRFADGSILSLDDLVAGDSAANTLTGTASSNIICGLDGDDTISGAGGKDALHGGAGADSLNGDDGDDILYGGAGADVVAGGSGSDLLVGGTGDDVYVLGQGSGADAVVENDSTAGNSDAVSISSGVARDQLWFEQAGDDLVISIIGTADRLTIEDWYSGSAHRTERFETATGDELLEGQVQNLVDAMAAFSPPAPGQYTLPSEYANQLNSVIAANWQ